MIRGRERAHRSSNEEADRWIGRGIFKRAAPAGRALGWVGLHVVELGGESELVQVPVAEQKENPAAPHRRAV